MGLHKKFTLFSVLFVTAAVALFSWEAFETVRGRIKSIQKEKVDLLSEVIANGLKTIMLEGRGKEFQKFLDTLIAEDIAAVRIYTKNGVILSSSIPGEVGKHVPTEGAVSLPDRGALLSFDGDHENREVYSKSVLIRNDQLCRRCHGSREAVNGILDVVLYTDETDRLIAASAKKIGLTGLAAVVAFSAAIGLLSSRRVKRPLDEMIRFLKKVEAGDLGTKIPVKGNDELARLAESLNAVISDLGRSRREIDKCLTDKSIYVERMASLGELAAAVAHDIKNPLAGISGALQVLAEDFPEDSPRKEIACEILNEIGRLDAAVKDLLMYARPPEPNLILTDINAIIEEVMNRIEEQAAALGVKITSTSDSLSETLADPEQLENAITNMALYCLQAMQGGGTLSFSTRDNYGSGEIEIALSDTGDGIRDEEIADVFKPSFSTKHSGTGLGLAISRNVVESHKGRVEVESIPGAGSTFHIFLRQKR
ncbi:MAG: ATP-binding protein [Nitrospiraceae bacterium]|nr:ATP-binding protein [Nitrospiraceae bacterium]